MIKNRNSAKMGKLVPQSQLGFGVIILLSIVILMSILSSFFLEDFFGRLSSLFGFGILGLAALLTWKSNVTNQNDNIFGKLKQACLGEGIIMMICAFIMLTVVVLLFSWLFGIESSSEALNTYGIGGAFLISSLVGLKSNKSLTKDGEKIERTWIDAFIITIGQIVIIFGALIAAAFIMWMIRVVSMIMWRLFGR
jgi:hypothetical protein